MIKIYYINDLHLDSRFGRKKNIVKKIQKFIQDMIILEDENTLKESLLIVAGDVSNFNNVSACFFKEINKIFGKVAYVGGNHDLYMTSFYEMEKYTNNSLQKELEIYHYVKNLENIHFLGEDYDGILNFKGLKIGGERMISNPFKTEGSKDFYLSMMNDSKYIILPMGVRNLNEKNINYYNNLKKENLDIFVSHYPVITCDSMTINRRLYDGSLDSYKTFVEDLIAPIYFFGHVHERKMYKIASTLFYTNAYGYPGEYDTPNLKYIELPEKELN